MSSPAIAARASATAERRAPRAPERLTQRPGRLDFGLYACLPLVLTLALIVDFSSVGMFGSDFHKEFWPAGSRILHGLSPYQLSHAQIIDGRAFPYPAPAGLLFAVFAVLSRAVAEAAFTAICIGALFATLRVLKVADWRLYGTALLWAPVVNAWGSANVTLVLALAIAIAWRHRDRPLAAGLAVALAVCLKPFVWPLGLWLLATRRYRAAAHAASIALAIYATAFAVVGVGQVTAYLDDLRKVSHEFYSHGYTLVALAIHLGLAHGPATAIGVLAALAAAVACLFTGRRSDDLTALTAAVALMLLTTPVLWLHYFVLVLVPLAIARPRLDFVWGLPILLFVCPSSTSIIWQLVLAMTVIAVVLSCIVRAPRAGAPA